MRLVHNQSILASKQPGLQLGAKGMLDVFSFLGEKAGQIAPIISPFIPEVAAPLAVAGKVASVIKPARRLVQLD